MIKNILTTVLLLVSLYGQAQDTINYKCNLFGLSLSTQQVDLLSPLIYYGTGFSWDAEKYRQEGRFITSKEYINNFSINTRKEFLISSFNSTFVYNKQVDINNIFRSSYFSQIAVGGLYELNFTSDIISDNRNNKFYFATSHTLGISLRLQKEIKKIIICNELSTSLLGLHCGSSYGSSFPYFVSEDDASFIDALHFGSIETYLHLKNCISVDFLLKQKKKKQARTLRVKYTFEYKNSNINNTNSQLIFHGITFGYLFSPTPHLHVFHK